ncbi:MAG: hypothetical protein LBC31_05040 [Treponema sp.]|jgi:hypothetical protein|nr:hypothetical protein [Treponema sp.]
MSTVCVRVIGRSYYERDQKTTRRRLRRRYDEQLTISGGSYELLSDYSGQAAPYSGVVERGKLGQTKRELRFSPEAAAGSGGEEPRPLSGPEKKTARRTLSYTLAEDGALVIDGREYRRPFTGEGAVYGGTMVRGTTRLNIRLSLGGFKDGAAAEASYLYTHRGIPIPLEGDLAGDVLELAEEGGLFSFPRFDPASETAAGFWLGGGWDGERGTYTVSGSEITFQPAATGSVGNRLIAPGDPESYEELSARDRTRMRTTIRYVLLGDTLTLTGRRINQSGGATRLNGRTYTKYRETVEE